MFRTGKDIGKYPRLNQ